MMEIIKTIFNLLSKLPAFTNLFKSAMQTGKIDQMDAFSALSSISPSTKKVADTAINTVRQGGTMPDVAEKLINMGDIEVFGHKANTKEMIGAFEKAGKGWGILANVLKSIPNQPVEDTVNLGNAMTDIKNWQEIVK